MSDIDLYDPATYASGVPHGELARLRAASPVHWQDIPGQAGYWAILKHADVEYVSRNPGLFSASRGGIVLDDFPEEQLQGQRKMLLAMDPPVHRDHRRPLVPRFGRRAIAELEGRVRQVCREALAGSVGRGEVDFVRDVASVLPTTVIGELFGIPEEDRVHLHRLAELATRAGDPGGPGPDGAEPVDPREVTMRIGLYGYEHAVRRRAENRGEPADLTDVILAADVGDGRRLDDADFGAFFVQIFTAGQDTTQIMLSSGLLALLRHPGQLRMLRDDRSLIGGAVEEILRWANPLHYFRRTATEDVELRGVRIRAGDKVAMYYTSANRDEEVFDDPHRFDITRSPNRHLSFGVAEHFCLGVHLARLEGRVFFEELLETCAEIEQTGPARRVRSNLNNGLASLPVRLSG